MNRTLYILDGHTPVACDDLAKYAEFFESIERRRVARETLDNGATVSTVFLGTDHNYHAGLYPDGEQRPILFETMIFGGPHDEYQERYCTWEEAEAGHAAALALAKGG